MDLTKESLEYLASRGDANIHEANGQQYSDRQLFVLNEPVASAIVVHSLSSLLDYMQSGFDGTDPVIVHIADPTDVRVYSGLNSNRARETFIQAKALIPQFKFGQFYDVEPFNIALQSMFVPNDDRGKMLQIVGNIKEEAVKNIGDDGVSQQVTARAGVATIAEVKVPNPVYLRPYRTFGEVEQPTSAFVFRMKSGPECAIFEADGGWWKNDAIASIEAFLRDGLSEEIAQRVTILA